ncbi:MAG: hypothetical protein HFG80_10750 [Eubacterium sp.]|nr:hypothetical protein [Eubacterium sp.]
MIKLSDYQTQNAFPGEMKTPERVALAYAYDMQKKRFLEHMECIYIYADLEKVADDKLDLLAIENRVLLYDPAADPEIKRNLIRNSLYWYVKLGTRQAMEEMLNNALPDNKSKVIEWFEYGGNPFFFRVAVDIGKSGLDSWMMQEIVEKVKLCKNARSRCDGILYQLGVGKAKITEIAYLRYGCSIKIKPKLEDHASAMTPVIVSSHIFENNGIRVKAKLE